MTEFEIKHGLFQDEPGPLELAASPVSTVEQGDAVKRLRDAIEGECSGVWISEKQAIAVLAHLNHPAPAAGDARDAHFDLLQDDMVVASASGPRAQALQEIQNYAAVYGQDGPVQIEEVIRIPFNAAQRQGDA
ncbi:MAG: hypothetical protein J0I68_17775 [Achromobacter sp.]|uniref:Uncharacterized protein n=1 Tax=Achromobacter insuavis TaxID=1287735 RepID=A0A6J4ZNS1_9BURK|nr:MULTISPECIES: hypothetical protein [Achromobacter]MBN9640397.1 hypothetical protein [Achromobacter sp.]CAB3627894.1 hypothetical protein LMG26845_00508 [Achromobacter insuavis]CUJ58476.1 Uncharacterised protein [Achromobacter sp. 2789STDY5608633]CUJ80460.1 Uncharacterised protein [Achromobacter sp. 2789STDY5608628]